MEIARGLIDPIRNIQTLPYTQDNDLTNINQRLRFADSVSNTDLQIIDFPDYWLFNFNVHVEFPTISPFHLFLQHEHIVNCSNL